MHFSQFVTRYFKKIGVFLSFRPPLNSFRPPQKWPAGGGEMSFGGAKTQKNFRASREILARFACWFTSPPPKKKSCGRPCGCYKF